MIIKIQVIINVDPQRFSTGFISYGTVRELNLQVLFKAHHLYLISLYLISTSPPLIFNFLKRGVIYCTIFIGNFTSCCFLKKIELLTLLLSVLSYLFVNFGGACENGCTVLFTFIFNYLLYGTVSSRWQYILIIIRWSSFRH